MTRVLPLILPALAACRVDLVVAQVTDASSDVSSDSSTGDATSDATADATAVTDATTTGGACALEPSSPCEGVNDPFRAIGLGCPATPIAGELVTAAEPGAYRVVAQFGNAYWSPREGAQLLVLTTGALPIPEVNGYLFVPAGAAQPGTDNAGDNGADLPPPIEPFPGSASDTPWVDCDGENDCSYSLVEIWENGTAADTITLAFAATAPADAAGFTVDLAWLSAEFPERADAPDGDLAIVWVSGEAFTGNLATLDGAALTPMSARARVVEGTLVGDHPAVKATGFEGVEGPPCDFGWAAYPSCPRAGALDWRPLRGPAAGGETIAVTIALMDRGDALGDTALLLDAWRWTCEACALGQTCGIGE